MSANIIEAMMDGDRVETARQRGERFARNRRARALAQRYGEPPPYERFHWRMDQEGRPKWMPPDDLPF